MSDRSRIEWCDATWNPIVGCTPISVGCEHCYARRMAKRLAGRCGYPLDFSKPTLREHAMGEPLRWKKPRRIFVCSMGDLFHPDVPPYWSLEVLNTMIAAPWHTFMILTKRPDAIPSFWTDGRIGIPPNVWLGTTVEEPFCIRRIQDLKKVQGRSPVRFVSCEPLLGPIDFSGGWLDGIGLVIVGGETGPGARPMHPDWVRSIRDQCQAAGVPFFFKGMFYDGKRTRLIDGREWNEIPGVNP